MRGAWEAIRGLGVPLDHLAAVALTIVYPLLLLPFDPEQAFLCFGGLAIATVILWVQEMMETPWSVPFLDRIGLWVFILGSMVWRTYSAFFETWPT